MKRAIFISIIFCASIGSSAQCLFDRNVDWTPFTSANKAISLNDGSWVIAGQVFGGFESNNLIRINCNGDTIWTASTEAVWISDIVFYKGKIYVTGTGKPYFYTDCISPPGSFSNATNYAAIYDTLGNLINNNSYDLYNEPYVPDSIIGQSDSTSYISCVLAICNPFPYRIAVMDSDNVLLSVGDMLVEANPNDTNSFGWKKNWQKQFKGKINDIQVKMPYIFVGTDSGLIKIDTFGIITNENYTHFPVTNSYKSASGDLYFIAGNLLLLTDSIFDVLDSFNLSQKFNQWQSLNGTDNNLIISGKEITNDSIVIAVFDNTLSFQNEFTLINQCNLPVDIAAFDSIILVTGNDSLHIPDFYPFPAIPSNATANTIYYKTYELTGVAKSSPEDISIISASNDSAKEVYEYEVLYMSLLLKNDGPVNINSISITTDNLGFDCVNGPSLMEYQNLNIPSGGYFKLDSLNYQYYYSDYDTLQLHFYITSINGSRVSQSCTPISIQSPPFIYDAISSPSIPTIKIFPNPTYGIVNIQSTPTANTIFLLTDINGRILMEKNLTQPNEQLNISALAQGMYIYTIRNGNQFPVTGKLVKQ